MSSVLPLLLLPRPMEADVETPQAREKAPKTSRKKQGQRLSGAFDRIAQAFKQLRVDPAGASPEKVLVLETRKAAAQFRDKLAAAVDADPRFEWLLDAPLDDLELPRDEDAPWRVYLVMTDHRGARELVAKFKDYKGSAKTSAPFAGRKKDKAAWFHLFDVLHDIRFWGLRDRLINNRTLEHWQEDLSRFPARLRFEVELWWHCSAKQRQDAFDRVCKIIGSAGGMIVGSPCIIEAIHYHGVLVDVPAEAVDKVLPLLGDARDPEDVVLPPGVAFLKCDEVMFFRPRAQADVDVMSDDAADAEIPFPAQQPAGTPIVALLDGMPLENHARLVDRIVVHDPEDLGSSYPASHRKHGTAMASLILHGDLQQPAAEPARPLVVQPIMRSRALPNGDGEEALPDDRLALDAFHVAVRRLLTTAETSMVRVINVSLGDRTRLFDGPGPSPWARLVDHLAHQHRLLFIVSAGNSTRDLVLQEDPAEAQACFRSDPERFRRMLLRAMHREVAHRKLISPGESINALTIGALHDDDGAVMPSRGQVFDPFPRPGYPSPVTSFGMGVRRSVKPDLVVAGGRQPLREPPSWTMEPSVRLRLAKGEGIPLGHRVAAPGAAGRLDATAMSRGTSNAAAITSRAAADLHGVLEDLRRRRPGLAPGPDYDAVLLKAMLVHGASWPDEVSIWREVVAAPDEHGRQRRDARDETARVYGYGVPDFRRSASCAETRATAIGVGTVQDGRAALFRFPLPACLEAQTTRRRLVVTLAYLTPIHPGHQHYRRARLWVEYGQAASALEVERRDVTVHAARRGTLEHAVLEGEGRAPDPTVAELVFKVNCRADAGDLSGGVPFAMLVTLEVAEGEKLPVYQQVAQRLLVRERGRA